MLNILFSGTGATLSKLQATLKGYALVFPGGNTPDAHFCEVRSIADLKYVPTNSPIPLYLIIETREREVIEQLKKHKIAGIFFPPLNKYTIITKLSTVAQFIPKVIKQSDDIEMIKIKILAKADQLPPLPLFAQRILALTNDMETSISDITNEIKHDQVISSKVIKMVNSPFYAIREDITSIDKAVVFLGFETVRNVALVASTNVFYNKGFRLYHTTGSELWNHAYITALIMEHIARVCEFDPDLFFIAGLLHDISKPLMVDFLVRPVRTCEDEIAQLGVDHAEIAAMILTKWKISNKIVNIIRWHHEPNVNLHSTILFFANMLAKTKDDRAEFDSTINALMNILPGKNKKSISGGIRAILMQEE